MLVGIDVDEVLADMNTAIISFHDERYGTNLKKEDFKNYNLWETLKCTKEEEQKRIIEFYRSCYFREMLPVEGAIEGVDALAKRHELIIITSRYAEGKDLTKPWLDKYFPEKFSAVHFTKDGLKKHELCKMHNVEVLIEDCIEKSIPCAQNGTRIILLDYPWNQYEEIPGITKVKSWKDIINQI